MEYSHALRLGACCVLSWTTTFMLWSTPTLIVGFMCVLSLLYTDAFGEELDYLLSTQEKDTE